MNYFASEHSFRGDVVVVTGATSTIGQRCVDLLQHRGARVAALGRDAARLGSLPDAVASYRVDLLDEVAVRDTARAIHGDLGPVRGVLCLAGGNGFPVPTVDETLSHFQQVVAGELDTCFLTIHAFLEQLLSHPQSSVVTMASSAAVRAGRSNAAYAAAKAGVIGLTRHLAGEFVGRGLRANCLAPGAVDNNRFQAMPSQQREALARHLPMGRLGTAQEVADAALFLLGPESGYTTGTVLELGGVSL